MTKIHALSSANGCCAAQWSDATVNRGAHDPDRDRFREWPGTGSRYRWPVDRSLAGDGNARGPLWHARALVGCRVGAGRYATDVGSHVADRLFPDWSPEVASGSSPGSHCGDV